jgi:hypothetical protein
LWDLESSILIASSEWNNQTAIASQEYRPRGDDGDPLEVDFNDVIDKTTLALHASHDHDPGTEASPLKKGGAIEQSQNAVEYTMPDWLKERLRTTMLHRWRQICYRRHHCASALKPIETGTVRSLEKKEKPSVRPSKLTATREEYVGFPLAPEIDKHAKCFVCPLCGLMLSPTDAPWAEHVLQDLSSYICVYKDCAEPSKTYATVKAWMKHDGDDHLKDRWSCRSCPLSLGVCFDTEDDYAQHVRTQHQGPELSEAIIQEFLVPLVRRQIPNTFSHCLFCGFTPQSEEARVGDEKVHHLVVAHMEEHMLAFALASMPRDVLVSK